jgi:hypothetical protein
MNSFISSFRAVLLALGVIAATEGVCALALRPGVVERTKFNLLDRFQSAVIFGKLNEFADSSPDVIQVGDSSGFHGVNPDSVMRHLDGLKYVNLSCCAALGYRGYYGIADFMLRRNPGIKAVVLYVSLNNLPRADLIEGQHQLGEFIQNALTTPFSYFAPATVALRQRIVDAMEKKGQSRMDAVFTEAMRQSTFAHNGWWAEHDRRLAGDKRTTFWRATCGESGVKAIDEASYSRGGQSYMLSELERFASLAAHHRARLIVLFHPFSCRGLDANFLEARRADVRTLVSRHRNISVLPKQILDVWPTEKFVSGDHLRVGYDEENANRVGKLLARALGIAPRADAPAGEGVTAAKSAPRDIVPTLASWRPEGALVQPDERQARGARIVESPGRGVHRAEAALTGLTLGKIVLLSFPAKAIGARGIFVEVQTAGRRGGGYCDLHGATAQRDGDMLDAGLGPQPDGWWRCWIAMPIDAPSATLRLSLINERLDPTYVGDGTSGAVVGEIELGETTRFLAQEPSPW